MSGKLFTNYKKIKEFYEKKMIELESIPKNKDGSVPARVEKSKRELENELSAVKKYMEADDE